MHTRTQQSGTERDRFSGGKHNFVICSTCWFVAEEDREQVDCLAD